MRWARVESGVAVEQIQQKVEPLLCAEMESLHGRGIHLN